MIYLVRHGRTASNASGLLLGHANPPLDELGLWQADRAGEYLNGKDGGIDVIISSPLMRTRQTANAMSAATGGTEVIVDDRFVELDYGEWDEQPISAVTPEQWATWQSDPHFAPPGGESLQSLHHRVSAAVDDVVAQYGDANVAIVSHVSPIKAAIAWALGADVEVTWRMFVTNAAISTITAGGGRSQLLCFNDTAHLAQDRPT